MFFHVLANLPCMVTSHQLYYVSSALSFYFIYDFCLYSDMSPIVSYFIRYLPLLLAIVTVSIWCLVMTKIIKRTVSWHGIWWIILLMYTHLLHTSMSILNCPRIPGRDGSHVPVSLYSTIQWNLQIKDRDICPI